MARRFKAAIINPNRTIDVCYINKKLMIGANAFRLGKKSQEIYWINPDYTITTTTKRLGMPFRYTTSYYKRATPIPLPINELSGGEGLGVVDNEYELDEDGQVLVDDNGLKILKKKSNGLLRIIRPIEIPSFKEWIYTGISSGELSQLFTAHFFNMVSKSNKGKNDQMMFYITIGTGLGVAFLIYYVMQTLPGTIAGKISALMTGHAP